MATNGNAVDKYSHEPRAFAVGDRLRVLLSRNGVEDHASTIRGSVQTWRECVVDKVDETGARFVFDDGDFQWIQLSHPLGYPVHAIEAAS